MSRSYLLPVPDRYPSHSSELETRPLAIAIGICLAFLVVGQLVAPGDREGWFASLTFPGLAVPHLLTLAAGLLYYPLFATVLYRTLADPGPGERRTAALILILLIMTMDWVWNFLFFGMQSPFAGFLGMVGSLVLLVALVRALLPVDRVSAALLSLYLLWVGWETVWGWSIWRLNPG